MLRTSRISTVRLVGVRPSKQQYDRFSVKSRDSNKEIPVDSMINFSIVTHYGTEIAFKIYYGTPFVKVMKAYGVIVGHPLNSVSNNVYSALAGRRLKSMSYFYEGREVFEHDTPQSIVLEEGHKIHVYKQIAIKIVKGLLLMDVQSIMQNEKLGDWMEMYCRKIGIDITKFYFTHKNERIKPEATAESMMLTDGDKFTLHKKDSLVEEK